MRTVTPSPPRERRPRNLPAIAVAAAILVLASLLPFYLAWRGFEQAALDAARDKMASLNRAIDVAALRQADTALEWGRREPLFALVPAAVGAPLARLAGANLLRDAARQDGSVDLAALIAAEGKVVAAHVIRRAGEAGAAAPPPGFVPGQHAADFAAVMSGLAGDKATSRVRIGGQLHLLSAAPLTGQSTVSRGAVVLVRRIDEAMLLDLSAPLGVKVSATPILSDGQANSRAARLLPGEIATSRAPGSGQGVVASSALFDDGGTPALLLEIRGRGLALERGRSSLLLGAAAGLAALVLLGTLAAAVLRKLERAPGLRQGGWTETGTWTDTSEELARESRSLLDDDLEGIGNRLSFDKRLRTEWNRAQRRGLPLSCLLVDVDHFERYVATLGETPGRVCLSKIAAAISHELVRSGDFTARYAGGQFAGVLPDTDLKGVTAVAKRVQFAVAKLGEPHPNSPVSARVTVSIGAATLQSSRDGSPMVLVRLADSALYAARDGGHDQIVVRDGESNVLA